MTDAAAKNTATTDGANNGGTEKADTEKRGRNGGKEKDVQGKRGRNKNRPRDDRPAQKDTLCPHVSEGRACNFGERWVGWWVGAYREARSKGEYVFCEIGIGICGVARRALHGQGRRCFRVAFNSPVGLRRRVGAQQQTESLTTPLSWQCVKKGGERSGPGLRYCCTEP